MQNATFDEEANKAWRHDTGLGSILIFRFWFNPQKSELKSQSLILKKCPAQSHKSYLDVRIPLRILLDSIL